MNKTTVTITILDTDIHQLSQYIERFIFESKATCIKLFYDFDEASQNDIDLAVRKGAVIEKQHSSGYTHFVK